MEYCDCDLRFWLDKRAATNGMPYLSTFLFFK